ncbi:MAG: AsmA family protein [Paludibacter sp.]|nr:AsmA family protein [Paludibacter sp.]
MAKSRGKKFAITVIAVVVVLFLALLIAPVAFKGKIMQVVQNQINKNVEANVAFDDVSLSFIRNFPNASVSLENLQVIGRDSFALDTLVRAKNINAVVNLKSLFGNSGYEIKRLILNNLDVNAHVLPSGKANWDIFKSDSTKEEVVDTTALAFNLKLKNVEINHSNIVYNDEQAAMKAVLKELNFKTSGDFTADSSLLKTKLAIYKLTFSMDKINYLSNANIDISADINANLNKMLFKLSENHTKINAIEVALNGWVQMLEPEGIAMDLSLNTEKVDFKSLLSLIPAIYSKEFKDLKADGKVNLVANAKGALVGEKYPTFNVQLGVENGWFQYPQLPSQLKSINLDLAVNNNTDKLETMIIDLKKLSFDMGGNVFNASAHVSDPMNDPDINAMAKGKIDLGQVKNFYPLESDMNLNGIFDVDMTLAGRMSYYEKEQYDRFQFAGNMNVSNMLLKMSALKDEVSVSTAKLQFTNQYANLSDFSAKTGKNDLSASGRLENFLGYALKDQTLKGNLTLNSNYLNLNDFMGETTTGSSNEQSAAMSVVEIPKNLNINLSAAIKELIYDKMNFTNARGNLSVANGILSFQNLGLQGFGGAVTLNGKYDPSNPVKPMVDMTMDLTNVTFKQVFEQIETFARFAPVLENLTGNFSTKISLNSALKEDMMPDLMTLIAGGSLSTQAVGVTNFPALTTLLDNLKQIPLAQYLNLPAGNEINLKNLLLNFNISDGKINTKPFDISLGDTKLNLGGASGLDKTLAWTGKATLPQSLNLGKFQTIGFTIGGTFSKPSVKLDLASTLINIVDDLKEQATQKITEKVEDVKQQINTKAIEEAQKQADNLRAQAKSAGDKLVSEAQAQGQKLVNDAKNPIAKAAAEVAAKKLVDEAQKKAAQIYNQADSQANTLVEKAQTAGN